MPWFEHRLAFKNLQEGRGMSKHLRSQEGTLHNDLFTITPGPLPLTSLVETLSGAELIDSYHILNME